MPSFIGRVNSFDRKEILKKKNQFKKPCKDW